MLQSLNYLHGPLLNSLLTLGNSALDPALHNCLTRAQRTERSPPLTCRPYCLTKPRIPLASFAMTAYFWQTFNCSTECPGHFLFAELLSIWSASCLCRCIGLFLCRGRASHCLSLKFMRFLLACFSILLRFL